MPAAAVIPAPIAYIKVVAVKKLVVELQAQAPVSPSLGVYSGGLGLACEGRGGFRLPTGFASFTVKKLECLKQA